MRNLEALVNFPSTCLIFRILIINLVSLKLLLKVMLLLPGVINNRLNLKSAKNWIELFARNSFLQCYAHCFSDVLPIGGSDHSPIIFHSNSYVFFI